MNLPRIFSKQLLVGLAVTCCITGPINAAHAGVTVPADKPQQIQMLSHFYYQAAIQIATQGGLGMATDLMEKVYRLNPGSLEAALVYAEFVRAQGDFARTAQIYQDLLGQFHSPRQQIALLYQISILSDDLKQPQAGVDALRKAMALCQQEGIEIPSGLYYDLGVLYAQLDRYDLTRDYTQKAVSLAPRSAAAWNNLGFSLAKLGAYQEGYQAVRKSLELDPDNANARDSMGYVLFNMGRFQESILEFEAAVKLNPELAESFLYMGRSFEATGQWERAINAYQRYLGLTPGDSPEKADIQHRLRQLQQQSLLQAAPPAHQDLPADKLESQQQRQASPAKETAPFPPGAG